MSVCALSVPVSSLSSGRRCSTFSGAGILGCVPNNSNTDKEDVVERKMVAEGMDKEAKLPAKKKRKKGLRIKGKRRRKKLILVKKFSKDLGSGRPVADAPALLASSAPEQDEEHLFESNIEKQIYLPSTRAKTSIVWHFFHVDPQYTWRAICNLCEKSVSRGKPGSHLGTSTLQRHLQARHSPHWTRANKFGVASGEEDFTLDVPLSPSSAGSSGSFEYISTDPLDDSRMGKKRDKSVSDALRAERGRFLIKSNIVKHALIPGTRAKTSAVWNFFYTDPQHISRAVCNICKRSVSRGRPGSHLGTSTLQRHLQATHPIHWAVANKDSGAVGNGLDEAETERDDLLSDALHGEKSTGSQDLTAEDLSDSDSDEPPVLEVENRKSESPVSVAEQDTLMHAQEKETTYCENSVSSQISQAIIQVIVEDMHPYNYFSTPAFQRFMQIVAPDYRLPSESYFFTKAVPQLYDWVREKIFLTLENVQSQKIHLTVDIWTHDPSTDYFIVTVHWVSLETEPSSSNNGRIPNFRKWAVLCVTGLAKDCLVTNILQELNDQIGLWLSPNFLIPSFIVSDNSSSVVHAIKDGGFTHVPCFLHCLNIVIQDFFCEHKSIENMLVAARKTCHHFSHSVKARQILQEFQNDRQLPWKNLKQDETGHWISTFYMLKWLLEHCYSVHHSLGRASGVVLTSLQWTLMTYVCDILKPFEEATQKVSVKATGLNQVLPLIHHLLLSLQKLREDFQVRGITQALNLVDSLSLKLETDTLLSAMLKSKPCILAALLDPCFKNNLEDFFPQGADLETYKQILAEEVCNYMESSPEVCHIATSEAPGPSAIVEADSFTSSVREGTSNSGSIDSSAADNVAIGGRSFMFPSAVAVVDEYFKEKYSEISGGDDPLIYWQRKVSIWPALTQVAIQYLSCPMCSWQSECIFTANSHFHPKQIMSLDFDNIEQLMFLKMNLKNVNYDYSTLVLSWDPENAVVQNNEKEILS
ncbi:PREDICTED: zinc finger BED domain-containing protein 6 [Hipposideros armiger]|uniref:Zinc finger BED domain-containing protein 6 n=1 Tax=Hipposideros armiger TaxID=186990 RepID=A0A8B7S123_HIPAR|nr:PREDICTED: zinc finger BED domain-containing protein 6 [Hipposideros armiger]